jgi:hypothetical protein
MGLREKIIEEIQSMPDQNLEQFYNYTHHFLLSITSSVASGKNKVRAPSTKLKGRGAILRGDDSAPAIELSDWDMLSGGKQ